jgi:hypothetical protein
MLHKLDTTCTGVGHHLNDGCRKWYEDCRNRKMRGQDVLTETLLRIRDVPMG